MHQWEKIDAGCKQINGLLRRSISILSRSYSSVYNYVLLNALIGFERFRIELGKLTGL